MDKITYRPDDDGRPFYDETAFVAKIIENFPNASDADIAAVRAYTKAIQDIIMSESFESPAHGLAFMVGLAGSTYNGLSALFQAKIEELGL